MLNFIDISSVDPAAGVLTPHMLRLALAPAGFEIGAFSELTGTYHVSGNWSANGNTAEFRVSIPSQGWAAMQWRSLPAHSRPGNYCQVQFMIGLARLWEGTFTLLDPTQLDATLNLSLSNHVYSALSIPTLRIEGLVGLAELFSWAGHNDALGSSDLNFYELEGHFTDQIRVVWGKDPRSADLMHLQFRKAADLITVKRSDLVLAVELMHQAWTRAPMTATQ